MTATDERNGNGFWLWWARVRSVWPVFIMVAAALIWWGAQQSEEAHASRAMMSQSERINSIRDKVGEIDVRLSVVQTEVQAISRTQERIIDRLDRLTLAPPPP